MLLILLLILSVVFIIVATVKFKCHPFLALLFAAVGFGLFARMPLTTIAKSINEGFGGTISHIGIVIVAGIIIGTFLERSGGAFAIADRILRITGQRQVLLAMSIIGYLVSVPVFADSGFVILMPLNRALSKRAAISLVGPVVALATGLTATHCLVPPTPGPIAAAGILGADLGLVILLGAVVAVVAAAAGWAFAVKIASKIYIDPNPELTAEKIESYFKEAPPALRAFMPILLPMLLIVLKSVADFPTHPFGQGNFKVFVSFIGEPIVALLIGVLLSFRLPKKFDLQMLSTTGWVGKSLFDAALIIMITGAGGAFGMMLRNSSIAEVLSKTFSQANLGIWLPFIIAAAIKTAQGSSTVALITTASLMAPLMPSLGFDSTAAKALVVTSISAGAMVVSHANDSFFWVITQMAKMDVKTGYRVHTMATLIMGVASGLSVWLISLIIL